MTNFLRILINTAIILAIVVAIGGVFLLLAPKVRELQDREDHSKQLLVRIDDKQREIKDVRTKQQRLQNDPSFVEHVARENRRIRPNEIVFVYDATP